MTIVGAWLPWSYDGPVRLGGLEGSHDGWLAVLSACAAIATVRGVRRGVVAADCSSRSSVQWPAFYFVLRDGPPPDSHLGWGWFVALVGTLGMFAAAIGSIVARLRGEPESTVGPPTVLVAASGWGWRPDRPLGVGVADPLAGDLRHRGRQLAPARRCDHRRRRAGRDGAVHERLTAAT